MNMDEQMKEDLKVAWSEAFEVACGLEDLTDEDLIECRMDLLERVRGVMLRLHNYVPDNMGE